MLLELIAFSLSPVQIKKDVPPCPIIRQCQPRKTLQKEQLESKTWEFVIANSATATPPQEPTPQRGGKNTRERQDRGNAKTTFKPAGNPAPKTTVSGGSRTSK